MTSLTMYTPRFCRENKVALIVKTSEEIRKIAKIFGDDSQDYGAFYYYYNGFNKENYCISFYCGNNHGGLKWHLDNGYDVISGKDFIDFYSNGEKEIIGWILTKPEYKSAVRKITGMDTFDFTELEVNKVYAVRNKPSETTCYRELKKAGVLDLWFEPVYKTTYKVGDWITVTHMDSLGNHWLKETSQRTFKLTKEPTMYHDGLCWSTAENGGRGIKEDWFRPATPEEIDSLKSKVISMGEFSLKVTPSGIYHGSENIKSFCLRLIQHYDLSPTIFDTYTVSVGDVIFTRTGCQETKTKLSDWRKVYNEYLAM